jgi:diacylglycerol kinase (ATP)
MDPERTRGVRRLIKATSNSCEGLADAWRHEEAFRSDVLVALIGVPVACWFGRTGAERAVLIGSLLLVPIVELLNTAIEAAIDRIGAELHLLSKRAKDLSSAAVMLSWINVIAIWLAVIVSRLIS